MALQLLFPKVIHSSPTTDVNTRLQHRLLLSHRCISNRAASRDSLWFLLNGQDARNMACLMWASQHLMSGASCKDILKLSPTVKAWSQPLEDTAPRAHFFLCCCTGSSTKKVSNFAKHDFDWAERATIPPWLQTQAGWNRPQPLYPPLPLPLSLLKQVNASSVGGKIKPCIAYVSTTTTSNSPIHLRMNASEVIYDMWLYFNAISGALQIFALRFLTNTMPPPLSLHMSRRCCSCSSCRCAALQFVDTSKQPHYTCTHLFPR